MNCHPQIFSKYVDYELQPIVKEIPSYVKDTKDFLKRLDKVKNIPEECLFKLDIEPPNTSIPNNDGIKAVKESFQWKKKRYPQKLIELSLFQFQP